MSSELRLTSFDEAGRASEVTVNSARYTIGRSPDNDLSFNDSNLSRRHALIERFDGQFHLTDSGSQNGTTLNGEPVTAAAVLRDGDRITLGGVLDLTVRLGTREERSAFSDSPPADAPAALPVAAPGRPIPKLNPALIAMIAGALVVIVASVVIIVLQRRESGGGRTSRRQQPGTLNATRENRRAGPGRGSNSAVAPPNGSGAGTPSASPDTPEGERVEQAAVQVMRRVSSDDKPYVFSERALRDITAKVEEYRGSTELRAALTALHQEGRAIAAAARHEGLEPDLVVYAGLAVADGGRGGGDPASAAREMIPNLVSLRATFGSGDADSSLISIAAYSEGGAGSKKSHPMLATMRRIVSNPLTERNVWFLHERGGVSPQAYGLVLRFLALGVVAQNPRQFGVDADPLVF